METVKTKYNLDKLYHLVKSLHSQNDPSFYTITFASIITIMIIYFSCFNIQPPPKVTTPFHKEDESKSNEQKINDSMGGVKKIVSQSGKRGATSEKEKERLIYSLVRLRT